MLFDEADDAAAGIRRVSRPSFLTTGDGCRIAYRFDGAQEAPVLMLSNSLGTTMEMWAPQVPEFSRQFRVLRYDTRGHGASGVPAGAYSMDRLGRDVIELLDGLGLARVDFCGLSLGGMIGQWLGIRAPERLGRLILANTSPHMGPPQGWDDRIAAVRRGGMPALADSVLERWFTPPFRAEGDEAVHSIRHLLLSTDPNGYAGCCAAIRDMDMRRTVALIQAPTLVIGGAVDPATPLADARALTEKIVGARIAVLQAAHLSNLEQPCPFNEAVLDLLAPDRRQPPTMPAGRPR